MMRFLPAVIIVVLIVIILYLLSIVWSKDFFAFRMYQDNARRLKRTQEHNEMMKKTLEKIAKGTDDVPPYRVMGPAQMEDEARSTLRQVK